MNVIKTTWFAICLVVTTTQAQQLQNKCDYNVNEALFYLKGSALVEKDSLRSIEYLKPCVKNKYPPALLVMGVLNMKSKDVIQQEKGFKQIKKAAKLKDGKAACYLGDLYKYGIGTDINIRKARKWYRKSHQLGFDKGTYSLGYMHYKGIGGVTQNYNKAVKLFKKSNYPMAKHWLAMAHYFGNGVSKNKQRALELLKTNKSLDSKVMLACMNEHKAENYELTAIEKTLLEDTFNDSNTTIYGSELISGKWNGTLIQMNWSDKATLQRIPVKTILEFNPETETTRYSFNLPSKSINGIATDGMESISFDDLNLEIHRTFFNHKDEAVVNYRIKESSVRLKKVNGTSHLIISLESDAIELKEPGTKFYMLLSKEQKQTENGKNISEEVISKLNTIDKFIKLYPNPFQEKLYIAYSLENSSTISIEVTNMNSGYRKVLQNDKKQDKGEYIYFLNGNELQKGMYIISVYVDGKKKTTSIIKK